MDEIEITHLLYRCGALLDAGKLADAAALFADARVRFGERGPWLDRDALLARWEREFDDYPRDRPGIQHLITNPVVTVDHERETATCEANYTLLALGTQPSPRIVDTGHYRDEFAKVEGIWRFRRRQCLPLAGAQPEGRDTTQAGQAGAPRIGQDSPQRAKIIAAAQQIFSTMGYSEAGIRKIADLVGVAPTILFRHFGTKANLFEEALVAALSGAEEPENRTTFGRDLAEVLACTPRIYCPHAMSVLSIGNEEAREIATRVMQEHAIAPMARWLGPPNAESRAREIVTLCAGFVLYHSQLNASADQDVSRHMLDWFATSVQAIVDGR